MRFLLDESAEVKLATFLESVGHDVKIVQRDFAVGLPDADVLALAVVEHRIVLTNDRDFGELERFAKSQHNRVYRYYESLLDGPTRTRHPSRGCRDVSR